MGKQLSKVKKILAILLAVLFVVSLTAASVSAPPPGRFGKGDGGRNWDRGGHDWDRDGRDWDRGGRDWDRGGRGWDRGGRDWDRGGWKGCGWWNNWCRWDRWGHGW